MRYHPSDPENAQIENFFERWLFLINYDTQIMSLRKRRQGTHTVPASFGNDMRE
jgi:hypothetical protein